MRKFLAPFLISATLLAACDTTEQTSGDTSAASTAPAIMSAEALAGHIQILSSDAFGGRAPASPGEALTVDYITSAFLDAGLQPVAGGSFTQAVPLTSITVRPESARLEITGGSGETLSLAYLTDQVVWTRRLRASVTVESSDMVFVGYGIVAPERDWDDYEGVDVRGKTVVMMINDPGFATQDPAVFNGNAMTYYGRWDYKFDEAARQGAVGAIMIHETKPAAYGWDTVKNSWSGDKFGLLRDDEGASLAAFEAWITVESATALFAKSGLDYAVVRETAKETGFRATPLGTKVNASVENDIAMVTSRNIIGVLPGATRPDDHVIYMAHWDHLGTDPNREGDQIYNGALDNASGTAALLELARRFGALETRPDRSILFLSVTAEEQGLLGSAYYASHPLVPLKDTVAGINMDGANIFGPVKDVVIIGHGNSELDNYLRAAVEAQGRYIVPDPQAEKGYFYRSDHFELAKRGVPMLYTDVGFDHREKGPEYGKAQQEAWLMRDYHMPSDEFDPDWDLSGAVEDVELFFQTGLALANSSDWPEWSQGTEFKAVRDAQRPTE